MEMYWATIWSCKSDDKKKETRRSFFATIEENQYKALLKITKNFENHSWAGSNEEIVKVQCEQVGEMTPTDFGSIRLVP